jgi:hypothetical protein
MGRTSKIFALFLTLTIVISCLALLMVKPANAQTIPKPTLPQFTVRLVDHSYDRPATTPTYTTDPYTGEQKQVTPGSPSYHIENKSIEITIKNQPFAPYNDSNGNYIGLYYNIRFKGHYGTDWTYDPFKPDGVSSKSYGGYDMTYLVPYTASNSEYTTITYFLGKSGIPNYGEVDFEVQAQIGNIQQNGNDFMRRVYGVNYIFTGESSDWSNTQTITLGESQTPTPSPATTPTPTPPNMGPTSPPTREPPLTPEQLEIMMAAIIVVVVIGAALGLLIYLIKRK